MVDVSNKVIQLTIVSRLQKQGIKQTMDQIKKLRGALLGASLSALFFGMAMRNAALQVWKTSTKTFQEVMHSVEGTVTQFDLLNGSMSYLKFTVGQALEPLATQLIPIVDRLSEIVQQNPDLVAGFVKWGIVIGTVLMVVGQLGTALLGLVGLKESLQLIGNLFKIMGANVKLAITNVKLLATAFKALSLTAKIGLLGVIGGIILALTWLWKMGEAMGGIGELGKSVIRGLIRVFALFGDFLIMGILTPLQYMVAIAARALSALGSSVPSWMQNFASYQGPNLTERALEFEQNSFLSPEKGYADGGGLVPTYNIDTVNVTADNVDEILAQVQAQTR